MGSAGLHDDNEHCDARLLDRFVKERQQAAFAAILFRHGPMVLGVCRRVLASEQDVEDAFQATFLVLARKAGSIRRGAQVGNWLYGVAYRAAVKARALNRLRANKEREAGRRPRPEGPNEEVERLLPLLDEELSRLPDRHRLPIVLCHLEGRPIREVAQMLGWPQGTLASRLARGRNLLAQRLARRTGEVTSVALAAVLTNAASDASAPVPLTSTVLTAAPLYAAGRIDSLMVSLRSLSLAKGVMRFMLLTKLKLSAGILGLMAAGAFGVAGVALGWGQAVGGEDETGPSVKISRIPAADQQPKVPPTAKVLEDFNADKKAADKKEAETKTLEKLKGTWKVAQSVRAGEDGPETTEHVVIDGKEITVNHVNGNEKAVFEIDPSADPMTFDIAGVGPDGKKLETLLGIIKIEKDKLTICQGSPGAGIERRPKEFTSTKENKCQLLVLERDKP
jgi:RNA polymerase sigma-70 factor (ECF subfamily)